MPLRGGATDKYGNRYEAYWTVYCIADLLDEKIRSIRLEPPGPDGEGVEFWTKHVDESLEFHQVKRQNDHGYWSLKDLARKGIISTIVTKTLNSSNRFRFVSTYAAYELQELSERARSAKDRDEYETEFLGAVIQRTSFDTLCQLCGPLPSQQVFTLLQQVFIDTEGEPLLIRNLENKLSVLVEEDVGQAIGFLFQFVFDNVHKELFANDVWRALEHSGFHRRSLSGNPHVIVKVEEANKRYLNSLRDGAIQGIVLPRNEVQQIEDALLTSRFVMVTGDAGVGKSTVLKQLVQRYEEQRWLTLAFRVDRLEYTNLPEKVGSQIGLPGSPTAILNAIAQNRKGLLVIDQLDYMSEVSGRRTEFFDCIDEIIRQSQSFTAMRVVIACRQFDLENDSRFRRLIKGETKDQSQVVKVQRLDTHTVQRVLEEMGVNIHSISEKQFNLLSIPLHLSLFAEILSHDGGIVRFNSVLDLYDRFWALKQERIRRRIGDIRWVEVIDRLCEYMSANQSLYAPEYILDGVEHDANTMVSEHVLEFEGSRYGFFHEGFFDYAFARRFLSKTQSLLDFLLEREQHLFIRTQVRQILQYQRNRDPYRYQQSLANVFQSSRVRFHIKQVLFHVLAQIDEPTPEEWDILNRMLNSLEHDYKTHVLNVIYGSPGWVKLLIERGVIQTWLQSSEYVDQATMILMSVSVKEPDLVAECLSPYIGLSPQWDNRLRRFFSLLETILGSNMLELFMSVVDSKVFSEGDDHQSIFWKVASTLSATHPTEACQALARFLTTIDMSTKKDKPGIRLFKEHDHHLAELLKNCAFNSSEQFVTAVLPFMFTVMSRYSYEVYETDELIQDRVWSHRNYGTSHFVEDDFLRMVNVAIARLAAQGGDVFRSVECMLSNSGFDTANYLLLKAYTSIPREASDQAITYLLNNPARLRCGYSDSSFWVTRELLEAVTPYCSQVCLQALEEMLLQYYPAWERSAEGMRYRGFSQMTLLEGISGDHRSTPVKHKIMESERRFGVRGTADAPQGIHGGIVQSPISEKAASKMTDAQWLKAIQRYDNKQRDDVYRFLVGGAHQLSEVLEQQVRVDPERFAVLILKLPDDTHPYYFSAILRGFQGSKKELAFSAVRRCHKLPGRPVGSSIARLIGEFSTEQLDDDMYQILSWYATSDPNPEQELWRTPADVEGTVYYGGNPLEAGINSVRGSAAYTIAQLIQFDFERIPLFLETIERLVIDPSIQVRACVALILLSILRYDRDLAGRLAARLFDTEDVLLGTHYATDFLRHALSTHGYQLGSFLKRMLDAQSNELNETGASLVALMKLVGTDIPFTTDDYMVLGTAHRKGICKVYAFNLHAPQFRERAESIIVQMFYDEEEQIRELASSCFHYFESEELGTCEALIARFVDSPAFSDHHGRLTWALEQTTAKLPNTTILVCQALFSQRGRLEQSHFDDVAMRLIMRQYQQADNEEMKSRCLDVIDEIATEGKYFVENHLNKYER